ncbi:MAG: alpha/beta hydrolase [Solirubrobacterales bacterium]
MPAWRPSSTVPLSVADRVEAGLARGLGRLPEGLLSRLVGPPTEVDGQQLDPSVQLILRLERFSRHPSFETLPLREARAEVEREARVFRGAPIELPGIRELEVAGAEGALPARLYVPAAAGGRSPLVVYLHGGGWVVGSLDSHDSFCRFLARESGMRVLSVAYRLAPEHPFPAPLDDAVSAFRDAVARAEELGADPAAVAMAGDSAGGNLTAAASLRAVREGGPSPAFQLLIYPVTDLSAKARSYALFREGFYLTESQMDWYRGHYLARAEDAADPGASPLLEADLSGAPPAHLVTAGFDVLRDEGEAYVARLRDAGAAVTHTREPGMIHAFINAVGISPASRAGVRRMAQPLRAALAATG